MQIDGFYITEGVQGMALEVIAKEVAKEAAKKFAEKKSNEMVNAMKKFDKVVGDNKIDKLSSQSSEKKSNIAKAKEMFDSLMGDDKLKSSAKKADVKTGSESAQDKNDTKQKSKSSFDNNKEKEVTKMTTRNEELAGKTHPETGVKFVKKTITVDGKKIEGVFPQFESKYNVVLPKELRNKSDEVQFKYCVKKLAKAIESNPELSKQFTPKQLEQIKNGEPRISGLTWHHSEIPGKMQLVNSDIHAKTGHTGGRDVWGGGNANR